MDLERPLTYEDFLKEIIFEDSKKRIRHYSPLTWYGGKFYMADKIVALMPRHECYVEPFFGAGHVFFKKPKAKIEIVNDIDLNIYSFFKVLGDEDLFNEFIKKVYLLYAHRKIFEEQLEQLEILKDKSTGIVDRAVAFFYRNHLAFGGKVEDSFYSSSFEKDKAGAFNSAKQRLFFAHDRLRNVFVECKDWKEVIKQYDSDITLNYCDPPYVNDTRKSKDDYENEMTNEQHEELVDTLLSLKSKVILSGYANPIYEKLEHQGWRRIDIETYCWVNYLRPIKEKRIESLWLNYELSQTKLF